MLTFSVECLATKPGEAVYIVGSVPELGSWCIAQGLRCTTTADAFPVWTSPEVAVNATENIEFKLVIATEEDAAFPVWEGGANKTMQLPLGSQQVTARSTFSTKEISLEVTKLPTLLENPAQVLETKHMQGQGALSPAEPCARDQAMQPETATCQVFLPSEMDAIFGINRDRQLMAIKRKQACRRLQRCWRRWLGEQEKLLSLLTKALMKERLAVAIQVQTFWKRLKPPKQATKNLTKQATKQAAKQAAKQATTGLEAPPAFAGKHC